MKPQSPLNTERITTANSSLNILPLASDRNISDGGITRREREDATSSSLIKTWAKAKEQNTPASEEFATTYIY